MVIQTISMFILTSGLAKTYQLLNNYIIQFLFITGSSKLQCEAITSGSILSACIPDLLQNFSDEGKLQGTYPAFINLSKLYEVLSNESFPL